MDKLYDWTVGRSGSKLTVTHSTGKVTGVTGLRVIDGKAIAIGSDKRRYELVVTTGTSPNEVTIAALRDAA